MDEKKGKGLSEEEMMSLRELCDEDKISIIMNPSGFSCVKIIPDSNKGRDKFFTFLVRSTPNSFSWKSSVWVSNGTSKVLKIYLESSSGVPVLEAFRISIKVFDEL